MGTGGVWAWGPVTNPTARALASWLCALCRLHEGARGGRLLPGCGASGVGRSPTPDCPPSGRAAGAHYQLAVGAGGCGRGDPSPAPQRALLRAGSARCGGGMRSPRGGRLLPGCGASGVGRSPTPDCPPSGRAAGGPLPTGCGCGGVHVWGPVTNPTARAFASWLCALWGRHEGARGGRLLPGCGASGVGRSPTPDCPPSGRAAGAHYPLAVGAGGCGRGDPSPTPQRALFRAGFARYGDGTRPPRGGRLLPGCGASGVGRSPTPDCPPSGRAAGAHYPLAAGAGGCGRGDPSPTPQRALLRTGFVRSGGGMRVPGKAPLAWVWGVWGRALSRPRLPALWAGCRGPLPTGCGCRGVRAWGLVTNPTARALSSWLCALWWRHEGARGGVPPAWVWGVRGRALSHPRLPALWAGCRGPLPTGCGSGGVRAWEPVTSPTGRALASSLCAVWGRHEGALGGRLLPGCGAYGVGRSPTPDCPPSGRAAGGQYPLSVGAGGCGRGNPSQTPQRALLRAGFARCAGGMRVPGGAPPAWVCGVRGRALSHPRLPALWEGCRGPLPTGCGCGGVRAWGPVTNPTARALANLLCALWGPHEGARGGRLLPGCGASGVRRSPTPDCPPSGRAIGGHYPLAVGTGGCGRGDPSPTRQRALLLAGFARCGGCMRVPGGGPSCLGLGRPGSGAPPPSTARPLGGLLGPNTHWLWVRGGAGVGTRHQPHGAPSFELALRAVGAARGRPGGGASCLGYGRPVSGAPPPPTAHPLGGLPGPTTHWLWVRGGAGVGTCHQPHSARSCELALRAVGAA